MSQDTAATVLVVDDDDDYAESITAFLVAHGYAVVRARSGAEGVRLARSERPGLVLMDVMMEERTAGFFAIQEIRRDPTLATVPILVVSSIYSAIPGFRVTPDAGWLSHDAFLTKPVDFDQLLARVREHLPPIGTSGASGASGTAGAAPVPAGGAAP